MTHHLPVSGQVFTSVQSTNAHNSLNHTYTNLQPHQHLPIKRSASHAHLRRLLQLIHFCLLLLEVLLPHHYLLYLTRFSSPHCQKRVFSFLSLFTLSRWQRLPKHLPAQCRPIATLVSSGQRRGRTSHSPSCLPCGNSGRMLRPRSLQQPP